MAKPNRRQIPFGSPESVKKSRSWFESLTTNGNAIQKFGYLAVRPEALEGRPLIFSQAPFFKGGFSLQDFNPSPRWTQGRLLEKHALSVVEGRGVFGENVAAIIQRIFDTRH